MEFKKNFIWRFFLCFLMDFLNLSKEMENDSTRDFPMSFENLWNVKIEGLYFFSYFAFFRIFKYLYGISNEKIFREFSYLLFILITALSGFTFGFILLWKFKRTEFHAPSKSSKIPEKIPAIFQKIHQKNP
jgi:hypothetical protein